MVRYTKFRDDRPIRSRVILGKPEGGGCINPDRALCWRGLTLARTGGCTPLMFFTDSEKTATRSATGFWATLWGKPYFSNFSSYFKKYETWSMG